MKDLLNKFGTLRKPFLFVIDFDVKKFHIQPLDQLDSDILYSIDGKSNFNYSAFSETGISLKKKRSRLTHTERPLN